MKQNIVTMTKRIDDNNLKHIKSLDTENKFLNPIWMWHQNNTRLTLYLGAVKISPYINVIIIMIFVISFLTLSMSVGLNSPLKLTQYCKGTDSYSTTRPIGSFLQHRPTNGFERNSSTFNDTCESNNPGICLSALF